MSTLFTPESFEALVRHSPAAMAVILVVWMFLRQQEKMQSRFQARLKQESEEVREDRARATDALLENAKAATLNAQAVQANSASVQALVLVVARCANSHGIEPGGA